MSGSIPNPLQTPKFSIIAPNVINSTPIKYSHFFVTASNCHFLCKKDWMTSNSTKMKSTFKIGISNLNIWNHPKITWNQVIIFWNHSDALPPALYLGEHPLSSILVLAENSWQRMPSQISGSRGKVYGGVDKRRTS